MATVARVMLEQIKPCKDVDKLVIAEAEFKIKDGSKVNVEKLCDTLTNEVFDRAVAEKVDKIMNTGFAISKPFRMTVAFNNRYVFDTDKLQDNYLKSRTQDFIKIKPTAFRKNFKGEKERFYKMLMKIYDKGTNLNKSIAKCIDQPKPTPKPKQAAKPETVAAKPETVAAKDKANETANSDESKADK